MSDDKFSELRARREAALAQGGPEGVARQHARGKLTARERIDRLLDTGSFCEMAMLAGKGSYDGQGEYQSFTLDTAVPDDRRKVFDVRRILQAIFDAGSLFEMARPFGGSIVTMLGRLDGCAVGVVANDPRVMGGALTPHAARKLERFVDLCDTFHLPIVNIVDQPGVMFGLDAEKVGTMGAALRAVAAIEQAVVTWCSVIIRRAFGVGGQMQGPQHGPDGYSLNHRFAWPSVRTMR